MKEPALNERLGAAIFIISYGVENTGMMTQRKLMHPHTEYQKEDVKRVAARLLSSVHTALLEALPPPQTEQILKDLGAYLSFALGDGWPDGNTLSQAT